MYSTAFDEYDAPTKKATLSVVLPPDLKHWLRVTAADHDLSISAYVCELLERERHNADYTTARSHKIREALRFVSISDSEVATLAKAAEDWADWLDNQPQDEFEIGDSDPNAGPIDEETE